MREMTKISADRITPLPLGKGAFSTIFALNGQQAQGDIRRFKDAVLDGTHDGRANLRAAVLDHDERYAHVTLDSIVDPTRLDLAHESIFAEGLPTYHHVLSEIAQQIAPFDVTFNTVRVNRDSVIILADNPPEEVADIRATFRNRVKDLASDTVDNARRRVGTDIVHYTVLRNQKSIPMRTVRDAVEPHGIHFVQRIDSILLVRSTNPALEPYTVVHNFPLRGTH